MSYANTPRHLLTDTLSLSFVNPCANTDWHVAFCHQLNRPLKGYIKFNEGSRCQVTRVTSLFSPLPSHLSLAASVLLAGYVLSLKHTFLFCHVTYETFWGLSVNESMLEGDNPACVDRDVAPPMSYQCVCAVSWILIERKSAQSGMSLWQHGASAFWWWWLAE